MADIEFEKEDGKLLSDFFGAFPEAAEKYEREKRSLSEKSPDCAEYSDGVKALTAYYLRKALIWSYMGRDVHIVIDRPMVYIHKKEKYTLTYPINYGYIPGVLGGDGEELDVYLLGVEEPVSEFDCRIIASVQRRNDVEDKLVAAPAGFSADDGEIGAAVSFQEKYYDSVISRDFSPIL